MIKKYLKSYLFIILQILLIGSLIYSSCSCISQTNFSAPNGFVEIINIIPDIILDLRYSTNHNFLGVPVDGYKAYKCYITKSAADSLAKVQEELRKFSLSLKIYDAYRPQRAVNHFVRWAKDLHDTLTKKEFYPTVNKDRLFIDGYIAEKSGHSRGSTVDLTIVPVPLPSQPDFDIEDQCECYESVEKRFRDNSIDMGTGFDCFHSFSNTESDKISPQQRANRMLLRTLMEKYGFRNLPEEWWHFTLIKEPFPDTFFDFEIR